MSVLLIESALKVSIILLSALVVGSLLRNRSAALRHWVLGAAVFCAWAAPPLSGLLPAWSTAPVWRRGATADVRPAPPADGRSLSDPAFPGSVASQTDFSLARVRRPLPVNLRAADVAWIAWLVGSIVSLLTLLVGLVRLRFLGLRARVIDSGPWCEVGERMRRAYGLSSAVRLLQSDHSTLLITWGWRHPKVLLPADASGWSRDRIHIVLAHEFAHIARGDWTVHLALQGLRALYWFNPLLWIACRRLRIESERACDDAVLARGIDGADYAGHLLALARVLYAHQPWLPAPAMARSSTLERRIRAMLNTTLNRRPVSWPARTATFAALLTLTLAVAALRAQSPFYSVSGTVLDATNRVLPDTRVVLSHAPTRAKYEVRSDSAGHFTFAGVPPATYTLEASLLGFKSLTETVEITADIERELQLRVGSLQETITVTDRPEVAPPPDASVARQREETRQRFAQFADRAKATCAGGGAQTSVGGNILAPRKLVDVRPIYPEHAKADKIGGVVTMDVVIGTDGLVREVQNLKGPDPSLEVAAADAVRQWQFSTTLLNCVPIEVEMNVTTNFSIKP
jgi:TonB family protein